MPGNPREMITAAERLFPVRVRIGVPPGGLGQRYSQITDWLDANCGADGWALTPAGTRGVLNDAISVYFADATLASAFVARWCVGYKVEIAGGVYQVREDEPTPRIGAGLHRTPRGASANFNRSSGVFDDDGGKRAVPPNNHERWC
ncbi:MAG: hypothetical protein JOZ17_15130 [Acetobacteraceae bacterium]|nr:hypothetical protein [Acetobacteraceae bacterium]